MSQNAKKTAGDYIASRLKDGDCIGLGSGTTTEVAIESIASRLKNENISISGVPTSIRTAQIAAAAGIKLLHPNAVTQLNWGFDGADAVDPELNLIKGRGGAILTEKVIAAFCKDWFVLVTPEKMVDSFSGLSIPVECIPAARSLVEHKLGELGVSEIELRISDKIYGPVITEHGNLIFDVRFDSVSPQLETEINSIPGVVENGIFSQLEPQVLVGSEDGSLTRVSYQNGKRSEIAVT